MVTSNLLIYLLLLFAFYTATVYIKMKKPNAAIRDANAALEVVFLDELTKVSVR